MKLATSLLAILNIKTALLRFPAKEKCVFLLPTAFMKQERNALLEAEGILLKCGVLREHNIKLDVL